MGNKGDPYASSVCSWALEQHDEEQPGDDELLDLATAQTLRHDGTVYGVKPEDVPGGQLLAAVYRY